MKIQLRLFANIRKYHPTGNEEDEVEAQEGITIQQYARRLGIPDEYVKIIFVNGLKTDKEAILREGDRVGIFPPLAGG